MNSNLVVERASAALHVAPQVSAVANCPKVDGVPDPGVLKAGDGGGTVGSAHGAPTISVFGEALRRGSAPGLGRSGRRMRQHHELAT